LDRYKKPLEETLEYLKGRKRIVIVGCDGCATLFHTGGKEEAKEKLSKDGYYFEGVYHPLESINTKL